MIVSVAEAAAALQAHDDILILTHRRPDGDTAGCAGALCRGLRPDRQAGVYSGKSGNHEALRTVDYALLSAGRI